MMGLSLVASRTPTLDHPEYPHVSQRTEEGVSMSAICLTLELEPNITEEYVVDVELLEELFYSICETIQQFLAEQFIREAERNYLEDIEEVIEPDCDMFEELQLTFLFQEHWYLGAELGYHWYQHALASPICQQNINEILAEHELSLRFPEFSRQELVKSRVESMPFVILEHEIVGINTDGEIEITEGVELELMEQEQELIKEVRISRLCQCQLCENARHELE